MTEQSRVASTADVDQHHVLAEEVRAFLVSVRGGAPFLSASDGRLLVGWLDQGVPIAAILSAIERTARRRAGRRLRTRMSLGACKGEVKKLVGLVQHTRPGPTSGASSPSAGPDPSLGRFADRVARAAVPDAARPARDHLTRRLRSLAGSGAPPDHLATQAAAAVRAFHEDLWSATLPMHPALTAQAHAQLAPLEAVVSAKVFADLLDEHTRQAVRALAPEVSVEPIWRALGQGAPA